MPVAHSILDTIGNTPLLELRRMPPAGSRVVVKWEAANPSGSVKIRPALHIVDRAEELGLLRPGSTIIESTSGNFGVALAMIGAVRGYRVVIVTDPKLPPQFVAAMRAYGAEMVLVDQPDSSGGYFRSRLAAADRLAREIPGSFRPDQHFSLLNPAAHHASTAPELLDQLDGARPDYLVVAVSTAGQLRGVATYFRRHSPATRLVAVDAQGSGALGGHTHAYLQTGIGLAWTPSNLDPDLVDEAYKVPDRLAFAACRALARQEGLLAGVSSGSVIAVALALAARAPRALVAGVLSDSGEKYLQTAYEDGWLAEHGLPVLGPEELRARCAELTPVRCEGLTALDGGPWSADTSWRSEPTRVLNELAAAALAGTAAVPGRTADPIPAVPPADIPAVLPADTLAAPPADTLTVPPADAVPAAAGDPLPTGSVR